MEELKGVLGDMLNRGFADLNNKVAAAEAAYTTQQQDMRRLHEGTSQEFITVRSEIEGKFSDMKQELDQLCYEAKAKFQQVDEELRRKTGGHTDTTDKKSKNGFLPDKMMIPKIFSNDVHTWRKWKEDVTKYFDEGREGIKQVMEDACRSPTEITPQMMQELAQNYPGARTDLEKWKHLYRALEKLIEGGAARVISTAQTKMVMRRGGSSTYVSNQN